MTTIKRTTIASLVLLAGLAPVSAMACA